MAELVICTNQDGIGEIVLNRPAQRNSLIGPLVDEMRGALEGLLADDSCRAIIIRGNEGYFCAGLDLKAFSADPAPEWRAGFQDNWASFHKLVFQANKPIIGALEGFAIAGGSALALACDFLVVGKSAFMHVSEVERNMMAPLNIFWLCMRFNYHQALRMALLGERHSAERLVALGIAEVCVDDEDVVAEARKMAARFGCFDSASVQKLKRAIRAKFEPESFESLLATIKQA